MASKGVNKVIIVGNLGQDPELRYLPSGGAVANITVATSESWRDKATGEMKEQTEWHRVVLFGKVAEVAGEYLRKGSQVYIEGKLQTRKWTDQQGVERYTTEIKVDVGGTMQMLGGKRDSEQPGGNGNSRQSPGRGASQSQNQAQRTASRSAPNSSVPAQNEPPMNFDDDVPSDHQAPTGANPPRAVSQSS